MARTSRRAAATSVEPGGLARGARACPTASRSTARSCSRPTGRSRSAAPKVAAKKPSDDHGQPELAEGDGDRQADLGESVDAGVHAGRRTSGARAGDRERQEPAEREADEDVGALGERGPCRSTSPRRHRRRRRTPRTASSPRRTGRWRSRSRSASSRRRAWRTGGHLVQQVAPVGPELPQRDREHDQRQTGEAEDVLHRARTSPAR